MSTVLPSFITVGGGESFRLEQLKKGKNNQPETIRARNRAIATAREAINSEKPNPKHENRRRDLV